MKKVAICQLVGLFRTNIQYDESTIPHCASDNNWCSKQLPCEPWSECEL